MILDVGVVLDVKNIVCETGAIFCMDYRLVDATDFFIGNVLGARDYIPICFPGAVKEFMAGSRTAQKSIASAVKRL